MAASTSAARKLVSSYDVPKFATNWLLSNCHVQTIVGAVFAGAPKLDYRRKRYDTPDGDFFCVDIVEGTSDVNVVVCHGLEGSAGDSNSRRLAASCVDLGWTVYAINYRGCHGEVNTTAGAYHVGFTDDVRLLVEDIAQNIPPAGVIFLQGYSLGGNIVCKFLGELGERAMTQKYKVYGGAVNCVPFDPKSCQKKADSGLSKRLYITHFLGTLKQKAKEKAETHPGAFDLDKIMKAHTIAEIDDHYIAAVYGFDGKEDYYAQSGSKQYLQHVRVPLLVMNAMDDPLIDSGFLPTADDVKDAPVLLAFSENGGHCGFVESFTSGSRYLGRESARFLQYVFGHIDEYRRDTTITSTV